MAGVADDSAARGDRRGSSKSPMTRSKKVEAFINKK